MLKKSLVLGVLAALAMAPAAFAGDQVQGSNVNNTTSVGNVGNHNRTTVNNTTDVNQSQSKFSSHRYGRRHRACSSSGNQVQGSAVNNVVAVGNVGNRNSNRINNDTIVNQAQSAACY